MSEEICETQTHKVLLQVEAFFFLVKVKSDHIFLVELVCIRSLSENLVL